eukprot:g25312.t1
MKLFGGTPHFTIKAAQLSSSQNPRNTGKGVWKSCVSGGKSASLLATDREKKIEGGLEEIRISSVCRSIYSCDFGFRNWPIVQYLEYSGCGQQLHGVEQEKICTVRHITRKVIEILTS